MRAGQEVTYHFGDGRWVRATVAAVVGSGPSGWKTLDLLVEGRLVPQVPHTHDATIGAGYWHEEIPATSPPVEMLAEPRRRRRARGPFPDR